MASEWQDVKPFIMNPYRDAENHGWDEWDEADFSRCPDTRLCRALDGTYGPCEPAMYVRAARAWQAFRDWCGSDSIRALEAKVRGMDEAVEWLERDRDLWHSRAKINEDRADKYAAQSAYLLPALSEARLRIEADRDRLAGEVERLKAACLALHAKRSQDVDERNADVARLTSELAAARENEARYLWLRDTADAEQCEYMFDTLELENWDDYIDAARRAGGAES